MQKICIFFFCLIERRFDIELITKYQLPSCEFLFELINCLNVFIEDKISCKKYNNSIFDNNELSRFIVVVFWIIF